MNFPKLSVREKIGWGITILFTVFIIFMSAVNKFTQEPGTVEQFASHGLDGWLLIVGIGEISSLILFLYPPTMRLGMVLFSAYFGGAIMFHMSMQESFLVPSVFLVLVWVIASLRQKGAILNV